MVPVRQLHATLRTGLTRLIDEVGADGVGDYLEFGVHSCSSMLCMYREVEALGLRHVRLFGFDSFQGLPVTASSDDEGLWTAGDFRCEHAFAEQILRDEQVDPKKVALTAGWFSDTLTPATVHRLGLKKVSVIMVDCDMYLSAREALTFSMPLITDHALMLFDDWNAGNLAARNLGEKKAFDEVLASGAFKIEPLPSYASNAACVFRQPGERDRRP